MSFMKKVIACTLSLLLLLSCSALDKKVDTLNYIEDIREMQENGKLSNEEAEILAGYILFLNETTFPAKAGISKTYRQLLKDALAVSPKVLARDMHNASNSLSYGGVYEGTLPCEDSSTVNVNIAITLDYDGNYTKKTTCLKYGKEKVSTNKGKFIWDENGTVITLTGEGDGERFIVVKGAIIMLEKDGKEITGDTTEKYRLEQTSILD